MSNNAFMGRIKSLGTGPKRLLLVIGIILSFVLSPFLSDKPFNYYFYFEQELLTMILFAGLTFVGFWIIVRIVLWIIDGFKK